jgi:RNA polymerase sigma factor (sigma-70 family)
MAKSAATTHALEELYRTSYPRFVRVARAIVGKERARDAVQESFARAIRARSRFRGEGSLEAWLWRILVNVCAEKRPWQPQVPLPQETAANGYEQEWPELRAAVASLPERQRHVLFLRHYADLDYETIAAALGIRRGTVAATLHAAHRTLRSSLKEEVR